MLITLGAPPAADAEEVGIWMRGEVLELWLRLLAVHVEDPAPQEAKRLCFAREVRHQWLLASREYSRSMVPPGIAELCVKPLGMEIVRNAIRPLGTALERPPPQLSCGVLNLMDLNYELIDNVETERLKEIA